MADRIAVLRDGRIVQYAAPADLYSWPADPALARFVGDANLVDGEVLAALAGTAGPGDGGAGGAGGGPWTPSSAC